MAEKTEKTVKTATQGQNSSTLVVENSLSRSFPSNGSDNSKSTSKNSASAEFSYPNVSIKSAVKSAFQSADVHSSGEASDSESAKVVVPAVKAEGQHRSPAPMQTAVPTAAVFVSPKPPPSSFYAANSKACSPSASTSPARKKSSKTAKKKSRGRRSGTPASPNFSKKGGGGVHVSFVRSPAISTAASKAKAKGGLASPKPPSKRVNAHYGVPSTAHNLTPNLQSAVFNNVSNSAPPASPLISPVIRVSRFSKLASKGQQNLFSQPMFLYWNPAKQGALPAEDLARLKALLVCRVANCSQHTSILTANFTSHSLYIFIDHKQQQQQQTKDVRFAGKGDYNTQAKF